MLWFDEPGGLLIDSELFLIQPVELTPTRLAMLSRNLPHDWQEQRRLLGFAPT
jgi:hypothetical protein